MDISFLNDFCVPVIAGICLCVGFVIKKWIKDIDNKFIPTINACLGLVLAVWLNSWHLSPEIVLQGMFSGLASTGLFEAFRQVIGGGE